MKKWLLLSALGLGAWWGALPAHADEDLFDSNNIIYYGRYNESQVGNYLDSSGHGYHGNCPKTAAVAADCSLCPTYTHAFPYPFLTFNGSTNCIEHADIGDMEGHATLSVSVWVKSSTTGQTSKGIVTKCNNTDGPWCVYVNGGNVNFWVNATSGSRTVVFGTEAISFNNEWRHLVATYDGTTVRTYMDGIARNTAARTGNTVATTDNFMVGSWDGAGNHTFTGSITEVMVLRQVLTRSQVEQLYSRDVAVFRGLARSYGWLAFLDLLH